MPDPKDNYRLYINKAHEMLVVSNDNLASSHYSSACNRAYYAIFYAASALLFTKGFSYSKHSAVISAFRQHFIKTGEFDAKWSKAYEFIMSSRQLGDYDFSVEIEADRAINSVSEATAFVEEVERWLRQHNHL